MKIKQNKKMKIFKTKLNKKMIKNLNLLKIVKTIKKQKRKIIYHALKKYLNNQNINN